MKTSRERRGRLESASLVASIFNAVREFVRRLFGRKEPMPQVPYHMRMNASLETFAETSDEALAKFAAFLAARAGHVAPEDAAFVTEGFVDVFIIHVPQPPVEPLPPDTSTLPKSIDVFTIEPESKG